MRRHKAERIYREILCKTRIKVLTNWQMIYFIMARELSSSFNGCVIYNEGYYVVLKIMLMRVKIDSQTQTFT